MYLPLKAVSIMVNPGRRVLQWIVGRSRSSASSATPPSLLSLRCPISMYNMKLRYKRGVDAAALHEPDFMTPPQSNCIFSFCVVGQIFVELNELFILLWEYLLCHLRGNSAATFEPFFIILQKTIFWNPVSRKSSLFWLFFVGIFLLLAFNSDAPEANIFILNADFISLNPRDF